MKYVTALRWTSRILAICFAVFTSIFAFDVFSQGIKFPELLIAFIIHLTPAILILLLVAISWNHEWVGGIVYMALGILYIIAEWGKMEWIMVISVPLVLIGFLFLISWYERKLHHL